MGSFFSLQIAKTGLYASQKALEVTGHNISNANTEGYSRQRIELSSIDGMSSHNIVSTGKGVKVEGITQLRDKYLDYQFRNENSLNGELDARKTAMEYIEGTMGEPSDYGISASLTNLFNSLEELSYNAEDLSIRETVVQNAVKLTDTFRTLSNGLNDYQSEIDNDIQMTANEVNRIGEEIADLNKTICQYELDGSKANDLRDKRNTLLDSLSKMVSLSVEETSDGGFHVFIGGSTFVDNGEVNKILVRDSKESASLNDNLSELYWEDTDSKVNIEGGKLKGLLDIRDGNDPNNQGIPYYLEKLDLLANSLVKEFNDLNKAGFTLPYENQASRQGVDFFASTSTSASNIRVSDALLESGYNIAASSSEIAGDLNWGNNENLVKLSGIRDKTDIINDGKVIGNLEDFFQKTVSDVAMTTSYYKNRSENQVELTNYIESQKLSVSEVSIDEEMTNLVQYQQSYNAAAKLITVIDDMLTTVINMVGN